MSTRLTVNLDAMIPREDFAVEDVAATFETLQGISPRQLQSDDIFSSLLRKPDFQRETDQWSPEQVAALIQCFVEGDLIPSIILWRSPSLLFIIDGCHRLSALRAWVEDDFGDGELSRRYFAGDIPETQRKAAAQVRERLRSSKIGSWKEIASADQGDRRQKVTVGTRTLPVQWLTGTPEKAEASFFRINAQGTRLDDVERVILEARRTPVAIATRAVFRAARGHRYWSAFQPEVQQDIEERAKELHAALFEPDLHSPIKSLDLPLGGSKGVRSSFQPLAELLLVASQDQQGRPTHLKDANEDPDGTQTLAVLRRAKDLMDRISSNGRGSLGLHPVVYFYGPTGKHSGPMFLGTCQLIAKRILNNDKDFGRKFSGVRAKLEIALIEHKGLIAELLQRTSSSRRTAEYEKILGGILDRLWSGLDVSDVDLVELAGMVGKVVVGRTRTSGSEFSEEAKSAVFITQKLQGEVRCALCGGYIHAERSISYDHRLRRREGGTGDQDNLQLTHPVCNQGVKA